MNACSGAPGLSMTPGTGKSVKTVGGRRKAGNGGNREADWVEWVVGGMGEIRAGRRVGQCKTAWKKMLVIE